MGGEIPTAVNWLDERWVAFQHRREAWLAEFAAIATGTVRTLRPGASVEHQSSTYPLHWQFGVNVPLYRRTTSSRAISTAIPGRGRSCASCSRT